MYEPSAVSRRIAGWSACDRHPLQFPFIRSTEYLLSYCSIAARIPRRDHSTLTSLVDRKARLGPNELDPMIIRIL